MFTKESNRPKSVDMMGSPPIGLSLTGSGRADEKELWPFADVANPDIHILEKKFLFHQNFLVPGFRGLFPYSSGVLSIWFRVGFRGLLPWSSGILFHGFLDPTGSIISSCFLLVLGRVPGLVPLVSWHSVPSSSPGCFWFWVGFRGLSFCSIVVSCFLVVLGRVPG